MLGCVWTDDSLIFCIGAGSRGQSDLYVGF